MLKFMYLLLLTFSTKVKAQNGLYPLTNKFTITNYEIQPNNEFLQEKQRGFIMWMRTIAQDTNEIKTAIDIKNDIASTTIQVYVQSLSVQQLLPAGDLCSPTFFFEYLRQLTAVLSNGRSCPIRTGTTIDIFKTYTENRMNPRKTCLGTQFLNFTLYDKLDKFKLITLEAETTSSGQACING